MKKILLFTLVVFSQIYLSFAQTTNISGIINNYTAVTNIPVCNPCSNTCNYVDVTSTTGFAVGDKVLIIQMKGATTDLSNTAAFGTIQSVGNTGLYEYKTIASITGSTLTFTSTLYNTYDVPGLVQVVRVPQYVNAAVTAKLTAQPWNGATGGILVFDVSGTLTLNADVDVTALGFRGGIGASNGTTYPSDEKNYFYTGTIYEPAAPKGEGIAVMLTGYELGRGAYANAGGGGNAHNGGGGGGSNGGAGGLGGNQYNTFTGSVANGIGGYAITYAGGDRMYMGGGGGAGHQNNFFGTNGGNGGGMIFINAATVVGNSHKIIAAGDSSKSTTGGGNDGAGGGGGGGAIKINATSFSGNISLVATGGNGGDNTYTATDEHAPGAGGGGGIICLASATVPAGVTTNVAGGTRGLYRSNGDNFGTTAGATGEVLNACNFVIPSGPKELKPNLGSDIQLCNPIVANLDARLVGSWYTYTWYKDNVLIPGVTSQTYSTNETGRFKVVVSSTGCVPGVDSVDITTNAATAVNATFCAPPATSVILKVTGSGKYKWWDDATAGTAVGKGLTYTTPALSATKTYYVEDTSTISGSVGPTVLNTTGLNGNSNNSQLGFSISQDIQITSFRVPFISYYSPPTGFPAFTITVEVVDATGASFSPAKVFTSSASLETVPANDGGNSRLYTFPFTNFVIPASLGSNLRLKVVSHTHPNGAPQFNQGAAMAYPYNSSISGVVTINGSYTNGSALNTSDYASFYDWQFKTRTNLCLRVPVVATLSCAPPTCTKPTNVTITVPAAIADTICQGSAITLKGTVTVPVASAVAGGFKYSWIKVGATPAADVVLQTASITPTIGSAFAVPDYTGITGALTNAGKYILRVEDGTSNSSSCFLDDTLTLVVNAPTTAGTISSNQEICSGNIPAALTGTPSTGGVTVKSYKWESAAIAAGPWTQASVYSTTATGFAPGVLTATTYFRRKDSSGVCASVPTNAIRIRVNNKPILSSLIPVLRDTLCVGENFNISTTIALADSTGMHASANGGYYFYWKQYQAGVVKSSTAPLPYKNLLSATKSAALIDSGMYYLIVQDGIGATKCKDSIGLRIVIHQAPTSKGLIASHQEICLMDASVPFTEVVAPLGNNSMIIQQQWYTTNDTLATPVLTKIVGANSNIYNAGSPTSTLYYVRKDSVKYCAAVATNFLKIRVNNSVVTDTILPLENDTLCISAGNLFQLKGVVDSTANASINKGYYFTWMKLQQPATVPVVVGTPGVYADYPPASRLAVESDSGTYYLIVQDGAGATVCQDTLKTKVVVYANCTIIPPTCKKPVLVSTTLNGNNTLCVGNSFTIQKDIIDTSAGPSLQGYYFSWRKINSAGSILISAPSATYTDLSVTNATQADSGRYYLIVQDGLGSGTACKDSSAAISIVINAPIATPVIAASDTICQGNVPDLFTGTTGSAAQYQWYISTDSFKTVAASQLISGAIADSYQAGMLSATSYFIRKDSVAACPAVNSNIITIQIDKPVVPGVVGSDTVVCSGSPILAFKEITAASGGAGAFNYQWQSSSDNVTFTDIAGATNNIYQSPVIISRTYFRRIDFSGVCGSQLTDTIFVDAVTGVNPGTIAGTSPTICYNTVPTVSFTNVTGASNGSGGPGSETYQWQVSTDNMYWTDIIGETGLSYTETNPLTDTMYYRRKVGMGPGSCDTSYTTSLAVNVYDPFVVGSIPTDITVCEGTSVTINELTAASGGGDPNTAPTYEWIESIDKGATWITSSGISNQVNYVTPALTDSIWYRRVVTVTCNKDTSNSMKINVDSINTVAIAMTDVSTCAGTDAVFAPVYSGEGTTPVYDWYTGTTATGPWTQITSAAGSSYTVVNPQTVDNGTFYRVVLTSSFVCNSGTAESIAELTVNTVVVPVVSIVSNPAGPVCDTITSVTYTATPVQGDAGAATYQWYDGITNALIPSETGMTYTPATPPSNGDQVYVIMTSDITCANPTTAISNKVILDVRVTPHPTIRNNDTTVCTPVEVILNAGNITSGSNHFQWYKNGVLLTNADQVTYIATANDFPGGKYTFVEDNGVCSAESDTVTITMLQSPSADAGSDITAVEGETISLHGSVSSNTTYLVWIPSAGLSDPYVLNPSLVVPGATAVYTLVAYNNGNVCSSSDAVTIIVEKRIVIPNVITVNGDGTNDTWQIENIENFPDVEILIYNRWGNLVWKSQGYAKNWDGTNYRNGEVLPDGTYFYIIDLHSIKVKEAYTGWVQIIK